MEIEVKPVRVPVPVKGAVCGLPGALSVMDSVPVRSPSAIGVNVTDIVQLAPAPNLLGASGQVELCVKSPELEIAEIVSGTLWLFLTLKLLARLDVPNN